MKNILNILFRFIAFCFLLNNTFQASATHLMGFGMSYSHISGNDYKISIFGFYDCSGSNTQPNIPVSNSYPSQSFMGDLIPAQVDSSCLPIPNTPGWIITSWTEVTQICPSILTSCENPLSPYPGMAYLTAERTYTLPCSIPYTFYLFDCCTSERPTSIPAWNPLSSKVTIPNNGNSSPIHNGQNARFCVSVGGSLDLSLTDPDGDSLAYFIDTTYTDVPLVLQLGPGYSIQQPLGPNWDVKLDSITGVLSCKPGLWVNGTIETSLITIATEEYDSLGLLVGKTYRTIPIEVVDCGISNYPEFTSLSNLQKCKQVGPTTIAVCDTVPSSFTMTFDDIDTFDNISLHNIFLAELPGATYTSTSGPTCSVSLFWTPPANIQYPRHFSVQIKDDDCPYIEISTFEFTIDKLSFDVIEIVNKPLCTDSSGSITLAGSGGIGPFSYLWGNGVQDSFNTNLSSTYHYYQVTDAGCSASISDSVFLGGSELGLNVNSIPPDCNNQYGILSTTLTGGQSPFNLFIANSLTVDTIFNLTGTGPYLKGGLDEGGYQVKLVDAAGCTDIVTTFIYKPDTCSNRISGTVYLDANGNCMFDSTEVGISNVLVSGGAGSYALTDSLGHYSFLLDTGSFIIKPVYPGGFKSTCNKDSLLLNLQSFLQDSSGLDFPADTALIYKDLSVKISYSSFLWNQKNDLFLSVKNNTGNVVSGAQLYFYYTPSQFSIDSLLMPFGIIDSVNGEILLSLPDLPPASLTQLQLTLTQKNATFLGDSVKLNANILPLVGDTIPENNFDTVQTIIVGPFDPNDKQVYPAGFDERGLVPYGISNLNFKVRFQNIGNYPATYVIIRDTISSNLDVTQYKTEGYSHPFILTVEEDSILIFTFSNINLPDSLSDPVKSQGFIEFELGIRSNTPAGTEINNRAAIYFDFNPPIFTNITRTTLYTLPEVSILPKSLYCIGGTLFAELTEFGKAPYTYSWSNGITSSSFGGINSILLSQSGWYFVHVTDKFGFQTSDSLFIEADFSPLAKSKFGWDFTGNGFEVAFADSSQNGDEYYWDFGNGNTSMLQNPVIDYGKTGVYIVKYAVTNQCGTDTSFQKLEIYNDAIDTWPFEPISVQPNPFTHSTQILFPMVGNWSLKLYDLRGKLVYQEAVNGTSGTINRVGLSDGIYTLEVSDGEHWDRRKVLITD